ncbi:MAG: glycosyltransferase family 2 protein [Alphaproteobacteria bacterium]|nr:glycosyltransferase family 2 protein [Alphaproteobacteria bacterium]
MSELISVILPTYNRAVDLKKAIESVLIQTYKDFELIVVDDGSSDETDELLSEIKDQRVFSIKHQINKGAAASRNTGIKASKGNYIAFLDSDDTWHPDKLEKQYLLLSKSKSSVGGCVTYYDLIYQNKIIKRQIPIQEDFYKQSLFGCNLSPGSTLMFKKKCLEKIGFQNENLKRFEDWEWQIRFSQHYDWVSLPVSLANIKAGHVADFETCKRSLSVLFDVVRVKEKKDMVPVKMAISYELFYAALKNKMMLSAGYYFLRTFMNSPFIFIQNLLILVKRKIIELLR